MKKLLSLLFFIVMLTGSNIAQVTISPDTVETKHGLKVNVGIRVKDFVNLVGIQFTLKWDPAVLTYDTVANFNLPGLDPGMIGANPDTIKNGKIALLWTSSQPMGNILADGATMLDFVFDVKGNKGDSTFITLVQSPVEFEALNQSGTNIGITPKIGLVRVGTPLSVSDHYTEANGYRLYNPDPNPFRNSTTISWESPVNSQAKIFITDLSGKQVYTNTNYSNLKGRNQITLSAKDLPEAGTYIFGIQSEKSLLTRKIILLK